MANCRQNHAKIITDLNDDCILHLFKFLKLKDQLSLLNCNARFAELFFQHAKRNLKSISTSAFIGLPLRDLDKFFLIAGEFIDILIFEDKVHENLFHLIRTHCINVKKLSIKNDLIKCSQFETMIMHKPYLRSLHINSKSCKNTWLNIINKTSQLENLYIQRSSIKDSNLLNLPNLKRLKLNAMSAFPRRMLYLKAMQFSINDEYELNVLADLPTFQKNLEILHLFASSSSVECDWSERFENLKFLRFWSNTINLNLSKLVAYKSEQLEALEFACRWNSIGREDYHSIAQFRNLRKLHFIKTNLSDDGLNILTALTNLVELKLWCCRDFTQEGLLHLIKNCCHLKWINIQKCKNINNEFPKALLPIIKQKRLNSKNVGCITILVYGCNITNLPMDYENVEMKLLVKFIFGNIKTLKSYDNIFDSYENDDGMSEIPFFTQND